MEQSKESGVENFDGSEVTNEQVEEAKAFIAEVAEIEDKINGKDIKAYLSLTQDEKDKLNFYDKKRIMDVLSYLMRNESDEKVISWMESQSHGS